MNAFFVLQMQEKDVPGNQPTDSIGRRIDMYFVAQGDLATVKNQGFMRQQIEKGQKAGRGEGKFLINDELKQRNLTVIDNDKLRERYVYMKVPLFNQVMVSGTGHGMQTNGADSALVAYMLDSRFADDPQYPNHWQPGNRDQLGNVKWGPPQPYSGAGGYVKVTALKGPQPRVFVEYHLVFDEPHGWFGGKATLVADLPIQYQSDIRSFRKNLKTFGQNQQAGGG